MHYEGMPTVPLKSEIQSSGKKQAWLYFSLSMIDEEKHYT